MKKLLSLASAAILAGAMAVGSIATSTSQAQAMPRLASPVPQGLTLDAQVETIGSRKYRKRAAGAFIAGAIIGGAIVHHNYKKKRKYKRVHRRHRSHRYYYHYGHKHRYGYRKHRHRGHGHKYYSGGHKRYYYRGSQGRHPLDRK